MSAFVPPVSRRNGKAWGRDTHWYVDGNGQKIPGVTTLLGDGIPKPALVGWAGNVTAEYAVDNWADLSVMKPSERLKILKACRYEVRDAAGKRGTEVHGLAERLANGIEVEVPDELAGHVESYVKFLDEWQPVPVLTEVTVVNYTIGYAGTLDSVMDMAGQRWLVDIKTSKGVYGETALQCAAYARAEFYLDAEGVERPMIPIDRIACIHVRADGYDLRPLEFDEDVFTNFRYAAAVARATGAIKSYVGDAIATPLQEAML